jgi:hypothetical protein
MGLDKRLVSVYCIDQELNRSRSRKHFWIERGKETTVNPFDVIVLWEIQGGLRTSETTRRTARERALDNDGAARRRRRLTRKANPAPVVCN